MLNRRIVFVLLLGSFALTLALFATEAKLTGTVGEWYGGSPTQSPKKRALKNVTVLAGANLDIVVGQAGNDRIRGKVAAKAITDEKGDYSLALPPGKYTVIFWKEGYTPQTESDVAAPGNQDAMISPDKSGHLLHRVLEY